MAYRHPTRQEKATYVQSKFDEIASHYDRFNDLITQGQHRLWKRAMVRKLGVKPGDRGLDLCCGTGDIAQRIHPALHNEHAGNAADATDAKAGKAGKAAPAAGGGLIAADFSLNMLRIASKRLATRSEGKRRNKGNHAPTLVMGADAMRLPFKEGSFQFLTIGYGLRNVTDLDACLKELYRVLAPGGMLASLDVGKVRNRWVRPFAEFYLFRVVPLIGRVLQPGQEMYTYLPNSTLDYPPQDALKDQLEQIGFEQVELLEFVFGASVIHFARKPKRV